MAGNQTGVGFAQHGFYAKAFGTPWLFGNGPWLDTIYRSSGIVRFVQGGVVKTFRCRTSGTPMGADAFIVFYGVRETVPCDEASIDALEEGDHPLLSLPRTCGLDSWTGRLTDGSDYHILLGKRIGDFGAQGEHEASISPSDLQATVAKVDALLSEHGIQGTRAFHFQFEAQY